MAILSDWVSSFFKCSTLLSKNPPKLSLDGNSSPNGLGHLLILGVNSLLRVIGVSFQLYSQLKKSPHDGIGVLGSAAVSTASQTTRLGRGSSVTTRDECASWRSYYGKTYLEWILKYFIIISFSLLNCTPLFPLSPSSLLYLIISLVPTC